MKLRYFIFYCFLFLPIKSFSQDVLPVNEFSGLNTDDSSLALISGQTPDSQNVVTDRGGLQGRKGFIRYSTQPASDIFQFPLSNGTRYFIKRSSNTLLADTGSGAFATVVSTIPTDRKTVVTILGDRLYFMNTTDGLKYWDTTSVFVASASINGTMLVTFKGRLAVAGIGGQERVLRLSKYLDGTTWIAPANATDDDAAIITISGALDENIQALYSAFQDKLVWFKKNSFGGIFGSRRSNFIQRTFSDTVGVAAPETIQDCDGYLRWLGNNRKVWEFDGNTYYKISDQVNNLFSAITQGDSATRSTVLTSQADWDAGTQAPTNFANTTLAPGDLAMNTTSWLQTTQSDFRSGSFEYNGNSFIDDGFWDTTTSSGDIQSKWPDSFNSLRTGTYPPDNPPTSSSGSWWQVFTATGCTNSATASGGTFTISITACGAPPGAFTGIQTSKAIPSVQSGTTFYFRLASLSGNGTVRVGLTDTVSFNNGGLPTSVGKYWFYRIDRTGSNFYTLSTGSNYKGDTVLNSTINTPLTATDFYFYVSTSNWQVIFGTTTQTGTHTFSPLINEFPMIWQADETSTVIANFNKFGIASSTTSRFTSSILDTGISSPTWSTVTFSTSGSGIAVVKTQVSADGASWDAPISVLSGAIPTSANKRYFRYLTSLQQTDAAGTPITFSDFLIGAYSSGVYTSKIVPLGNLITSWGPVTISDTQNGGSIFYQIGSTSTNNVAAITNWTPITSNSIPTISTNAYAAFRSTFTSTSSTAAVSLHDFTFAWTEGSTLRPASGYTDQRYWLSVATNSTTNNIIYVYDRKKQWQHYSGINADTLGQFNSNLYFGNSTGIYQTEQGYSDAGSDITAYYKTKDFAPSGPDIQTIFNYTYLTTDSSDGILSSSYQMNGSTTSIALGSYQMNQPFSLQNFKIPFPVENVVQGKFLNLKWNVTGTDFWRIINADIYNEKGTVPN